jgi:hypothetical protein
MTTLEGVGLVLNGVTVSYDELAIQVNVPTTSSPPVTEAPPITIQTILHDCRNGRVPNDLASKLKQLSYQSTDVMWQVVRSMDQDYSKKDVIEICSNIGFQGFNFLDVQNCITAIHKHNYKKDALIAFIKPLPYMIEDHLSSLLLGMDGNYQVDVIKRVFPKGVKLNRKDVSSYLAKLFAVIQNANYKYDVLEWVCLADHVLDANDFILLPLQLVGYDYTKRLENKFRPGTAHLLFTWYPLTKLITMYPTNFILQEKYQESERQRLSHAEQARIEKERFSNMTTEEKHQLQRKKLLDDIEHVGKECPPSDTNLSGICSFSYISPAIHEPAQVAELYPNLQGHNFMPLESEFGLIDVNYLVSKVIPSSMRNTILVTSKLPSKPGSFSQCAGRERRGGYPAWLVFGDIEFTRHQLYLASQEVEGLRKRAEKALFDFDNNN